MMILLAMAAINIGCALFAREKAKETAKQRSEIFWRRCSFFFSLCALGYAMNTFWLPLRFGTLGLLCGLNLGLFVGSVMATINTWKHKKQEESKQKWTDDALNTFAAALQQRERLDPESLRLIVQRGTDGTLWCTAFDPKQGGRCIATGEYSADEIRMHPFGGDWAYSFRLPNPK